MARLFAFIGNRADLGVAVLESERQALVARAGRGDRASPTLGWGVGFYQAGEVLLRRRPIDDRPELEPADLARDVRSDLLIGHVRVATVGSLRTENTHPFRYRNWLFAHTGTIEGFPDLRDRLAETLPEFLLRNVRGETDSELLFHLFLSFLHDAGQLADQGVPPAGTRAALRSTVSLVDRLSAEVGAPRTRMNMLVTDGEVIVGLHRDAGMAYRVLRGRADIERILGDDALRKMRLHELQTSRFTVIASDFDAEPRGWTPVPDSALVTGTRQDDPTIEAL